MNLRGIVLIAFSAACLGVAGIAHHQGKTNRISSGLANLASVSNGQCGSGGFDTAAGHVGCLQNVSYGFIKGGFGGLKKYFGGDAFNGR